MTSGNFYDDDCYYNKTLKQSVNPYYYITDPNNVTHKDIVDHKEYQSICNTVGIHNRFRLQANTDLCQVAPQVQNNWGHLNSSTYRNPEYDTEKTRFTTPIDGYREMSIGIHRIFQYNTKPDCRPYVFIPKNTQLEEKDMHYAPNLNNSLNSVNPNNVIIQTTQPSLVAKCCQNDSQTNGSQTNGPPTTGGPVR